MKSNIFLVGLLGALLTALLLLVSPFDFDKYFVKEVRSFDSKNAETIAFVDMDGDGVDDFFECGYQQLGTRVSGCTCRLMEENGLITVALEQFNVPNMVKSAEQIQSSDYDRDGYPELWILSGEDDKVFLYGFEGPDLNGHKYRYLLDSANQYKGEYHVGFDLTHELDLTGDGNNELIFSLSNGFPIHPRRNYRLDIAADTVIKSTATSAGFGCQYRFEEKDRTYFTGSTRSSGNHKDTVDLPYPDTKGYIFVFDENLNFLFDPIHVVDYPDGVETHPFGSSIISVLKNSARTKKLVVQKRELYNGKLLNEKEFLAKNGKALLSNKRVTLFLDDKITILNENLEIEKEFTSEFQIGHARAFDLNLDGKDEFVVEDAVHGKKAVLDAALEYFTPLPGDVNASYLSPRINEHGENEFASLTEDEVLFFMYSENPYHLLKWPHHLFILLFSFGLSYLLFKFYRKNLEGRFEKEREFNRLQILSLKNQIDPHFALNALNSIDWMYKQEEPEKASRFMETYSRLVHQTVKSSDKISVSLFEELSFCRKFCELQVMRDPDFTYSIDVSEDVDAFEIEVPRQLLFTHVENAVKHGLRPKESDKKLNVKVLRQENDLLIQIENNGRPYQKSGKTSGTGKGLEIHQQLIDIYFDLKKVKIASQIGPCRDGTGTCVEMRIANAFEPTH